MKTLRRLIYGEVVLAVGFVTLGFLALFFFFDFVDELQNVGKNGNGYQLSHALSYVLLQVPSHLYELMPISVLIGTIFVMARFAQSSEFTILRTSGLGPAQALRTLLGLGLAFVLLTPLAMTSFNTRTPALRTMLCKAIPRSRYARLRRAPAAWRSACA